MPNLKLIISIINFLKQEGNRSDLSADTKESLEGKLIYINYCNRIFYKEHFVNIHLIDSGIAVISVT